MKKYTISNKKCRKCGGLISWDDYPSTQYPIHVDSEGNKIETGSCPKFRPLPVTNKSSFKPKPTPKPTRMIKRFKIPPLKSPVTLLVITALVVGVSLPIALLSGTNQNATSDDNNNYYNPPDPPDPPNPPDPPPSPQWEIDAQGTVTYIVDGDTFDVNSVGRIRLADIDCPDQGEAGCQEATNYVSSLINGKPVYVDIDDVYGTDPYDRTVAVVYVRHNSTHLLNVNKDLLVQGLATIWNFDNEFNPYAWSLFVYYV